MTLQDWPALELWFQNNGEEYPWGENSDPYRVWISEIMLQQTQVRAVIPHFLHWMELYPDIRDLAKASEDEVLKAWEGLGYYSRARNILKTAKLLEAENSLPRDYRQLVKLPGLGPYTASAVSSISFNEPNPVMDANVKRLCQRWGAHREWNGELENQWLKKLSSIIEEVPNRGLFNCALMQLGQLLCKKGKPPCGDCPILQSCKAGQQGNAQDYPKPKKKTLKILHSRVLLFVHGGTLLLEKRDRGIGRGLWSPPRIELSEAPQESLPAIDGWALKGILKPRAHLYTTNRENLYTEVLEDQGTNGLGTAQELCRFKDRRWVPLKELRSIAVPSVYRTLLEEFLVGCPSLSFG